MRFPRARFTLRQMIAVVAFMALIFAFALDIYPSVGKFVREETPIRAKNHAYVHIPLVALLTAAIALPLLGAVTLISKPATNGWASRSDACRLIAAIALVAVSAGIAALPVDGLRFAQRLRSDNIVSYLYQYSIWPGRHTEFCLEVIDSHGRHRYLIGKNDRYLPQRFFTNADQSVLWLVDESYPGHRGDGVHCSLNLVTGRFVGPSGPHPAVVTETGGFTIAPYVSATPRTPSPSGASSGQPTNRNAVTGEL
jgi:MFS family permease